MSHIRNLFNNSSEHEHHPLPVSVSAASVATVRENVSTLANAAPAAPAFPDFAVEHAHLRTESRLIFHADPRNPASDRFRLLRMRLKEHRNAGKLKKLLITSPLAQEGKSTVTLNLATALAERGKRTVLVVDADMHHPTLSVKLNLDPWAGLTDCLADNLTPPLSVIRRIEPLGLYFMPAGEPRGNPTELLQTPAFGGLVQKLTPYFDWILIDTPPVILLTNALSMQHHTDASLLVVRAGQTPREAVEQTVALLGKKNIVSIVLNGVKTRDHLYAQYYNSKYYKLSKHNGKA